MMIFSQFLLKIQSAAFHKWASEGRNQLNARAKQNCPVYLSLGLEEIKFTVGMSITALESLSS